jgi:hypothetical protein
LRFQVLPDSLCFASRLYKIPNLVSFKADFTQIKRVLFPNSLVRCIKEATPLNLSQQPAAYLDWRKNITSASASYTSCNKNVRKYSLVAFGLLDGSHVFNTLGFTSQHASGHRRKNVRLNRTYEKN